jgi:2-methylisocitrate lyase-like PEP mutase family enzyme
MSHMSSPAAALRSLLAEPGVAVMPCCFDALSAKLIELAGFRLTFMSGFAVSAAKLALPDTGLISYAEMRAQAEDICRAVRIPVLGDGDTGYGNAINVKRTVAGYGHAGLAAIMIEDQVAPKRCGHTRGKQVVSRAEALTRVRAAVDARNEGEDILIIARTDARATDGFDEALYRIEAFQDLGADIVFLEAPLDRAEMSEFCRRAKKPALANMLEQGKTPILPPKELESLGYKIAAYPLTLLSAAVRGMQRALADLHAGHPAQEILSFEDLKRVVGFDAYYAEEARYATRDP